jgi:hypothetical protein
VFSAPQHSPFLRAGARPATVGEMLLMSKETLAQLVLADSRVHLAACVRQQIRAGLLDRRALAVIELLAASHLDPTIGAHCSHRGVTAVAAASRPTGGAIDVTAMNGVPVAGHQRLGSQADRAVRELAALQGTMKPSQIVSAVRYPQADNTVVQTRRARSIRVAFHPLYGANTVLGAQASVVLQPAQWSTLVARLARIANPHVPAHPSRYALNDPSLTATGAGR